MTQEIVKSRIWRR